MSSIISASTTSATALNLTADTSGQLEIKTGSAPTTAITVDTSQRAAFVAGTAALPAITTTGDTNTGIFFPAADTIAFSEGGAEAMRIDSSGNVLVGTTTNNSRNPRLALNGNSVTWSVGPSSSNSVFVVYNPSEAGVFLPSGNTSWSSASDETLKENLQPITNAIDKVNTLKTVIGNFIADEEKRKHPFLIAQDVEKVLPEAVTISPEGTLGLSYTDVIPLLVAAIKEQQTIINDLKARITAIEGASL